MVNNNQIPVEVNKKPFETVYELKNEIPSYEEFMKTYETDGNLNYADLGHRDLGVSEGYGPCLDCNYDASFRIHIEVPPKNWFSNSHRFIFVKNGSEYVSFTLNSVEQAKERLREFENGTWKVRFEGYLYTGEGGTLTSEKNRIVRRILKDAIRNHEEYGYRIDIDRQLNRWSESA